MWCQSGGDKIQQLGRKCSTVTFSVLTARWMRPNYLVNVVNIKKLFGH